MKKLKKFARIRRAMSRQFGRKEALRRWAARDFSLVDFRVIVFNWCDFQGVDFSYSNFHSANFSGVDFSYSNFHRADFSGADFSHAKFRGAKFTSTNLSDVSFRGAGFQEVDFHEVDLYKVILASADFAESVGIQWADCSWHGHGEIGRRLLALRLPNGIHYFCGCFSGDALDLRRYISSREPHLALSREMAWKFVNGCFT